MELRESPCCAKGLAIRMSIMISSGAVDALWPVNGNMQGTRNMQVLISYPRRAPAAG